MQMSHEIRIESMRLAMHMVKDCIRRNGVKLCNFKRTEIVDAARALLAEPSFAKGLVEQAWSNCKRRYEARRESVPWE